VTTIEEMNAAKAEEFGGKVVGWLNGGALAMMFSVGHRTALFDRMADLPAATSDEIARAAGLNERYVREWLGALVTAGVVEYDPADRTYRLPPEHAAALTRAAGPNNFAQFSQYFSVMGAIEDQVVECFRTGGGVPYSAVPKFQTLQREETAQIYDATLINLTLPLVASLVERLHAGIDVLDAGCGAGHAINVMARAFPNSRFAGYDFSEEGIALGRAEAASWGLRNATFELKDVATLDDSRRFDLITAFDTIHDQAKPQRVLEGIAEALKPGGVFLCVDIAASSNLEENIEHPLAPLLYTASTFHCMTVSLSQGGDGLGTMWGEQKARELFAAAGFTKVEKASVEGDILNAYYVCRK